MLNAILISACIGAEVWMIGDSITKGMITNGLDDVLSDVAVVEFELESVRTAGALFEVMPVRMSERGPVAVAVIGALLWDIARRDLEGNALPHPRTSPAVYRQNLRALIAAARGAPGGPVVIVSLGTPVQDGLPYHWDSDVRAYNAIALEVVSEYPDVRVNDLYGAVSGDLAALQLPDDIHFTPAGYGVLRDRTADAIRAALPLGEVEGEGPVPSLPGPPAWLLVAALCAVVWSGIRLRAG